MPADLASSGCGMASAAVDKRIESYRRLHIYGTKSRLYVVGHDEQLGICRILKFRRQDGPRLDVVEDPLVYSPEQCNLVLRKVHEQSGGLQLVCKVRVLQYYVKTSCPYRGFGRVCA